MQGKYFMKIIKKIIMMAVLAFVLCPALANANTCKTFAGLCGDVERGSRLTCAKQWYDNGAYGDSSCKTILADSYYTACTNLAVACTTYKPPALYDTNTTKVAGITSGGSLTSFNCPTGQFIHTIHVRYGVMASSSLPGSRFGYLAVRCTGGNDTVIVGNNLLYGQRLACDTGQLLSEIKGHYNTTHLTALSGNCKGATSASPTNKYMTMVGVTNGTAFAEKCAANTFANGITVRVNSPSNARDKHFTSIQLNCAKFKPT
jgi:hypothetical protein